MMPARKAGGHLFHENFFYEGSKVNHTNWSIGLSDFKNIDFQNKIQNFLSDFYKKFSGYQRLVL